jgi:hypothetical protein
MESDSQGRRNDLAMKRHLTTPGTQAWQPCPFMNGADPVSIVRRRGFAASAWVRLDLTTAPSSSYV